MTVEIKVPDLPESVADAVLVDWHVKVGDFVKAGDNLVDLETDKVVLELPAPVSGKIVAIDQPDGQTVVSGMIVAKIDDTAVADGAKSDYEKTEVVSLVADKKENVSVVDKNSSPAARKIAVENSVDTSKIAGSGRSGRVTKNDVQQHIAVGSRYEERVPMTRMRKRIAERLVDAQKTAAMLTTFNEIDMKPIMDLRKKYQDQFVKKHGIKLGFMSFFVRASIEALRQFPAVNASIDGDDIIYHNYYDIGIAVSGPRGLVVPILRNAENLGFADIEEAIKNFAQKTKDGSLSLEEMTGGTFSITNGGTFGSMLSTPILNPPQSGILGMHNIVERAVVVDGKIEIRPVMYVALTYDHRIIDGREAVSFLVALKNALEDPARMLLNI